MFNNFFRNSDTLNSFWVWFIKNSDNIYNFEDNQDNIFTKIKKELSKVNPDLVFEFSPILSDGKRQFIISADGIRKNFPIVTKLLSVAPAHENWNFIAFRQPKIGCNQITYNGLIVNFEDIFFQYGKDFDQITLKLSIRKFYESSEWTGAIFILLDTIIGEYQSEMLISKIEKQLLIEDEINDLYPITILPIIVQEFLSATNN